VPAYVLVGLEWHDHEAFAAYRREIVEVVERHGGRFLASSEEADVLEGDWRPARVVVIQFPSVAAAREWYGSDDYRPLHELRARGATTDLLLVDGLG